MTALDGRRLAWVGFHTGARVLTAIELATICRQLLGVDLADLDAAVAAELKPHAPTGAGESCLGLNSATTLKGCFEADLAALAEGRSGDDFATYNEVRAVYLAGPNDLVVGRTEPWREAVEVAGVASVCLPDADDYYLSQALLRLAVQHGKRPVPELERIIDFLRRSPAPVVRVFALDVESRVLLVWLKRRAGLVRLRVDANGPEIADRWNHKSSLYPTVDDATALRQRGGDGPRRVLEAESALTPFGAELGLFIPRLPGYTIVRDGATHAALADQIGRAAGMLGRRYGLGLGCFKPASALSGSRIRPGVALDEPDALAALADLMLGGAEDFVLEAHTDYLRHSVEGHDFTLTPSVHIRAGELGEGASLQITRGSVWQGNVYVDDEVCTRLGLSVERYDFIRSSMGELIAAFSRDGGKGLVKGGIDFAVARIGGAFGDEVLVAMQDLNLSSNGAEYVRAFLDETRRTFPAIRAYAATKTVRPAAGVGLRRLKEAVDSTGADRHARAIASCPGRWGLIAVGCADPVDAAEEVLRLELSLARSGMIEPQAPVPPRTRPEAGDHDRSSWSSASVGGP